MIATVDGDIYTAAEHLGVTPDDILDFSSNVYPHPATEAVRQAIAASAGKLDRRSDPHERELRARAGAAFGVAPDHLLAGGDACEFIYLIPRVLRTRRAVVAAPGCPHYWRAADQAGAETEGVLAPEAEEFRPDLAQLEMRLSGCDLLLIGNPNDPTGMAIPAEAIRNIAQIRPTLTVVVDESYADFLPDGAGISMLGAALPSNVIVLRSLSPFHGLAGLRIGFLIAAPETCARIERLREPWPLSTPAQAAACALFEGGLSAAHIRESALAERERLREELSRLHGIRVFRSQANFLLLKITQPSLTSTILCDRLLSQRVLVRNASGFRGLDAHFIRVSVRTPEDDDRLIAAMRKALDANEWK